MITKLLGHRILVDPIPGETVQGGIHLVQRLHPPSTAKVVAVGSKVEWPELKPGQRVAIRPMGGTAFDHDDKHLLMMPPEAVLGMLVPAE